MSDGNRDVKVRIETEGDPSGVDKVAASVGKLKDATGQQTTEQGKQNDALKTASQVLSALGSRGSAAKDVIEGVNAASKGGTAAIFGMAKAAQNLINILANTNPFVKIISLIVAVGGAAAAIYSDMKKGEGAVTDFAAANEEASKSAETFSEFSGKLKAKLADLAQQKLDASTRRIAEMADELERAGRAAKQVNDEMVAVESAGLSKAFAEIDLSVAQGKMTEEEGRKQKADLRYDFELKKSANEGLLARDEIGRLQRAGVGEDDPRMQSARRKVLEADLKTDEVLISERARKAASTRISPEDLRKGFDEAAKKTEEQDAAMSPRERANRGIGMLSDTANVPGMGKVGGDIARAVNDEAAKLIREAFETGKSIEELVPALQEIGATFRQQRTAYETLRRDLDTVKQQLKNGGTR